MDCAISYLDFLEIRQRSRTCFGLLNFVYSYSTQSNSRFILLHTQIYHLVLPKRPRHLTTICLHVGLHTMPHGSPHFVPPSFRRDPTSCSWLAPQPPSPMHQVDFPNAAAKMPSRDRGTSAVLSFDASATVSYHPPNTAPGSALSPRLFPRPRSATWISQRRSPLGPLSHELSALRTSQKPITT